eukprot:c13380_g1_i1.p1 GENE.c13380_g1_i1~~c13380_g1_i1.p1  ORF type:complete len:418 (-),score=61.49 c13380_g1_i1:29-1201(-)
MKKRRELGLPPDKFKDVLMEHHSIVGIARPHAIDAYSRGPRTIALGISVAVAWITAAALPLLMPITISRSPGSSPSSNEIAFRGLAAAVSCVLSMILGAKAMRTLLRSPKCTEERRYLILTVTSVSLGFSLVAAIVLTVIPRVVGGFPLRTGVTATQVLLALAMQFVLMEPLSAGVSWLLALDIAFTEAYYNAIAAQSNALELEDKVAVVAATSALAAAALDEDEDEACRVVDIGDFDEDETSSPPDPGVDRRISQDASGFMPPLSVVLARSATNVPLAAANSLGSMAGDARRMSSTGGLPLNVIARRSRSSRKVGPVLQTSSTAPGSLVAAAAPDFTTAEDSPRSPAIRSPAAKSPAGSPPRSPPRSPRSMKKKKSIGVVSRAPSVTSD